MEKNSRNSFVMLEENLEMLRDLDILHTCSNCLGVFDRLHLLRSCGHTFCEMCVDDARCPVTACSRSLPSHPAAAYLVRCPTCFMISDYPILFQSESVETKNDNNTAFSFAHGSLNRHQQIVSPCDSALSSSLSSSTHSYPNLLAIDSCQDDDNAAKTLIPTSHSEFSFFQPLAREFFIKDLFGHSVKMALNCPSKSIDQVKIALSKALGVAIADLEVRFFDGPVEDEDNVVMPYQPTVRIVNPYPLLCWWWRPDYKSAITSSACLGNLCNPFSPQSAIIIY